MNTITTTTTFTSPEFTTLPGTTPAAPQDTDQAGQTLSGHAPAYLNIVQHCSGHRTRGEEGSSEGGGVSQRREVINQCYREVCQTNKSSGVQEDSDSGPQHGQD